MKCWFLLVRVVALVLALGTCADAVVCSLQLDDCLSVPSDTHGPRPKPAGVQDNDCFCCAPAIVTCLFSFDVASVSRFQPSMEPPALRLMDRPLPERPP